MIARGTTAVPLRRTGHPVEENSTMALFNAHMDRLRDEALELRDLTCAQAKDLLIALAAVDIVLALLPDGKYTVHKGKDILDDLSAAIRARSVCRLVVRVSNLQQSTLLGSVIFELEDGKGLLPFEIEAFAAMMREIQDAPDLAAMH
jgi:hypothetical protein